MGSRGRQAGGTGRWEQCDSVHSQPSGLAYPALCPPALPYWLLQLAISKSSLCPWSSVRLSLISVPIRLHYLPTAVRQGKGRFNPWVRKMPWRRKWQPTPVSCLENPMDRGAWGTTIQGVAESATISSYRLLLLLSSIFPSIRVFSNESALR